MKKKTSEWQSRLVLTQLECVSKDKSFIVEPDGCLINTIMKIERNCFFKLCKDFKKLEEGWNSFVIESNVNTINLILNEWCEASWIRYRIHLEFKRNQLK